MSRSEWRWALVDAQDRPVQEGQHPVFTSRFDAETWLGESGRSLAASGAVAAELREQDRRVGPTVPLHRP